MDGVAGEVWSDLELIWANCRLYNGKGSWVDDAAQKLQKETAAMWSAAGLPSIKRSSGTLHNHQNCCVTLRGLVDEDVDFGSQVIGCMPKQDSVLVRCCDSLKVEWEHRDPFWLSVASQGHNGSVHLNKLDVVVTSSTSCITLSCHKC